MTDKNKIEATWCVVADDYMYVSPNMAPMRDLVAELALSKEALLAYPATSHFTLVVTSADHPTPWHWHQHKVPVVDVEYWPQVSKFKIRFYHFQGVGFDQKWCDLPEAVATLKWAFGRLKRA